MNNRKKIGSMLVLSTLTACMLAGCSSLPFSPHRHVDEGMALLENGDYEDALSSLDQALVSGENKRLIYRGRGLVSYRQGAYEDAAAAFRQALQETNGILGDMDFDLSYYLADCYMHLEDYPHADAVYSTILSIHDKDRDAWYLRGRCRLKMGNTKSAMEDFTTCISINKSDYDQAVLIYEALADAGEKTQGKQLLDQVTRDAGSHISDYEKGRFAYYSGDYAAAQSYLEKARSDGNTDVLDAVLLLGRAAQEQKDFDYAQSVYESYIKNNQEDARVYNQLGLCQMKMGQYDQAITSFESGLKMDDPSMKKDISWNRLVSYEYKGEFGTALQLLDEYLTTWPSDETAKREKIFLSSR